MIFDLDKWKEIGATLARNKTRTFLTAFGIFWGTAMLTLLIGGGQGLQELLKSNFAGFATNSAVLLPSRTTMAYKGYQKGTSWQLTLTDVDMMRKGIPQIETLSPIASFSSTFRYGHRAYSNQILGVEDNYIDVLTPIMREGRFINAADVQSDRKVCVIGVNVATSLFGTDSPIGKFIEANNVYYRVVGVVKQRSNISIGGKLDESVLIPISTMRRTYNMGDRIHFLMLVAKPGEKPSTMTERIYHLLRLNHPIHPDDKQALQFMDISENFEMVDNLFLGVNVLLWFVGFSSLLAGIIGVGNIMWIIVKERTKEFGIRRALGAKPRTILGQIMAESAVLTLVAGTAAICFSALILGVATRLISAAQETDINFQISFSTALVVMALFVVLGCLAGSIPAIKAMRIKPVEALNDK